MKSSSKPGTRTSASRDDVRATDPIDRLIFEAGLRIRRVQAIPDGSGIVLNLSNGSTMFAPLDDIPQLAKASARKRMEVSIVANGTAIGWDALDVHLSLKGFLMAVVRGEVIRRLSEPSAHTAVLHASRARASRQRVRN